MLADGPELKERQTKRNGKLLAALLVTAAAGIAGAWLLAQNLQLRKPTLKWLEPEDSQPLAVSDTLAVWENQEGIQVCNLDGTLRYTMDVTMENPAAVTAGDQILLYNQTTLLRLDRESGNIWNVTTGIDAAAVCRDGRMAIITAASGYLTVVKMLSAQGETLETRSMEQAAAAMVAFRKDGTLAVCYVTDQGRWILETDEKLELPAAVVYGMQPCGAGVALWTSDGITVYDQDGKAAEFSVAPEQVRMWACGDVAAAVVWQSGGYRLVLLSAQGTYESQVLGQLPQDIAVWKSFAALLDSREVLIYDNRSTLWSRSVEGASACQLWAVSGGFRIHESVNYRE